MYHSLLETSGHCETEANVRSICVGLCAYLPAVKRGPIRKNSLCSLSSLPALYQVQPNGPIL